MQGEPPGRLSARSLQEPLDSRVSFQDESIWQLVPGVSSSRKPGVVQAVWKMGYWHIARSQIMQFAYDGNVDISSGCHAALGGKPLEATFTPTWVEPLEQGILVSRVTCASTFPSGIDDPKTGMKRRREVRMHPQKDTILVLFFISCSSLPFSCGEAVDLIAFLACRMKRSRIPSVSTLMLWRSF